MLQTQQHKFVNWQCDMEYRGDDFTAAVTLGNPDVLVGSGMFVFLKLQGEFVVYIAYSIHQFVESHNNSCNITIFSGWMMRLQSEVMSGSNSYLMCIYCNFPLRHFGGPLSPVYHTSIGSGW